LRVGYDPAAHRILASLCAPLQGNQNYTIRVTTGIADLAVNPLDAEYSWQFNMGGASPYRYVYLPLALRQ